MYKIKMHIFSICERVLPRLAHANSAVGLSAVKVIMKLLEMLDQSGDFVASLNKKLAPPLVTLLSAEAEIQYVALRNINLIVQKRWVKTDLNLAMCCNIPIKSPL